MDFRVRALSIKLLNADIFINIIRVFQQGRTHVHGNARRRSVLFDDRKTSKPKSGSVTYIPTDGHTLTLIKSHRPDSRTNQRILRR